MQKLLRIFALGVALFLTACAGKAPFQLDTVVSRNTLYTVEASYGVALAAAKTYKALPLCKTGTAPSITNICAKRSVVVRLQQADAKAIDAITRARDFIKANPTVDASNFLSAAQSAVDNLQAVLNSK
jgi:hypothetical protein